MSIQPNQMDSKGKTPLHIAACFGHADAVQVLIRASADIDITTSGEHAILHHLGRYGYASRLGYRRRDEAYAATATILLRAGADIHVNKGGWTPLEYVTRGGYQKTVRELILRGAELTDSVKHYLKTQQAYGVAFYQECETLAKNRLKAINRVLDTLLDDVVDAHVAPFASLTAAQITQLKRDRAEQRVRS